MGSGNWRLLCPHPPLLQSTFGVSSWPAVWENHRISSGKGLAALLRGSGIREGFLEEVGLQLGPEEGARSRTEP